MAITRLGGANAITGTLPAANINDTSIGNVTALPAGVGGKVLQVVTATDNTQAENNTANPGNTGLTVSITPSSASNKIFIIVSQALGVMRNDPFHEAQLLLLRDTTVLQTMRKRIDYASSQNTFNSNAQSINYLDAPSSTSSLTYKTQFKCTHGNNTERAFINYNSADAFITVMEIAG